MLFITLTTITRPLTDSAGRPAGSRTGYGHCRRHSAAKLYYHQDNGHL